MNVDVITVRSGMPVDMPVIDRVLAESYCRLLKADYPPSTIVMAVPLMARANPALIRSGNYFVAEDPAIGVIGAGGWSRSRRTVGAGEIRHFVTDHRHLRRGVGSRLMDQVLRDARSNGITRMECLSTRTGAPFYRSAGFSSRGEVTVVLGPGIEFPVIPMRLDI